MRSNKGFGGELRLQHSGGSSIYNTLYLKFHGENQINFIIGIVIALIIMQPSEKQWSGSVQTLTVLDDKLPIDNNYYSLIFQ